LFLRILICSALFNLTIEFRWAEGHYDRLPELATDLVRSKVEVIATSGGDIVAGAAKAATAAIPIVFISGGDPVARGFAPSFARPGGNMTGVSLLVIELVPKRLELGRAISACPARLLHGQKRTSSSRSASATSSEEHDSRNHWLSLAHRPIEA